MEKEKSVKWEYPIDIEKSRVFVHELVLGIAHQLRNPLAIIKSNTQWCMNNLKLNKEAKKRIEVIIKNIQMIEKRIDEFIEFTRPVKFKFESTSIHELINDVLLIMEDKCKERNINITKYILPGIQKVMIDQVKIKQALLNIIMNSIEAMPNGGILKIEAGLDTTKKFVIIKISDTGIGIKKDHLSQIGMPFFTTKENALGLGLSLVKQVISAHNGSIEFSSIEGKGTTVIISLPI